MSKVARETAQSLKVKVHNQNENGICIDISLKKT